MKPRTKRERLVVELSSKLPAISDKQKEWAKEKCFAHVAYRCKDEMWCSECGKVWVDTTNQKNGQVECPYCHHSLDVKVSRKQKNHEENYISILQVKGGFQVIRHFLCSKYSYKETSIKYNKSFTPIGYTYKEVVQEWISKEGKRTIMALAMNTGCNSWIYNTSLSIKSEYGSNCWNYRGDIYAIWGEVYSRKELLPELRKRGLGKSLPDVNPSKLIRNLLIGNNDTELCLKTKQLSVLQHLYKIGSYCLKYKHSFNICNRNGYLIKDASIWYDYMDLLSYFQLDTHNAHYVCPKNLKEAHDELQKRKEKIEAKLRRERERIARMKREEKIRKDITRFLHKIKPFLGIKIKGNGITIRPLESVTQYYQEWRAMHHCVYTKAYYTKDDTLVLSAQKDGKRLETIEVSLKTFSIIQSRGACNYDSEYHSQIVDLMKKNMNLIRQRMIS